jgi:sphinganine-1-phosphate aldolase
VSMCLNLFNNPHGAGTSTSIGFHLKTVLTRISATSGGTESILMACKAYRDWARATKGITRPEMQVGLSSKEIKSDR